MIVFSMSPRYGSWLYGYVQNPLSALSPILGTIPGHVRTLSANERRRYKCNVFSYWPRSFSNVLRQNIKVGPLVTYVYMVRGVLTSWGGGGSPFEKTNKFNTFYSWKQMCTKCRLQTVNHFVETRARSKSSVPWRLARVGKQLHSAGVIGPDIH